jgi:metal-dependent amidase/aminoacylase/carboxypeptidase family protein
MGIRAVEQRAGVGTQILWVIPEGGTQNNVIPDRVVVDVSVWCYDEIVLQRTINRIHERVQRAIANTNVAAIVTPNEPLYLPLEPSEPLVAAFERNLKFLNVSFEPRHGHLFDATDIGNVSHVVPTLHADMFLIDCHDHTPEYAAAGAGPAGEHYLANAMQALALTAFDLLRDPDDLARAKRQLEERNQPKTLRPGRIPS